MVKKKNNVHMYTYGFHQNLKHIHNIIIYEINAKQCNSQIHSFHGPLTFL